MKAEENHGHPGGGTVAACLRTVGHRGSDGHDQMWGPDAQEPAVPASSQRPVPAMSPPQVDLGDPERHCGRGSVHDGLRHLGRLPSPGGVTAVARGGKGMGRRGSRAPLRPGGWTRDLPWWVLPLLGLAVALMLARGVAELAERPAWLFALVGCAVLLAVGWALRYGRRSGRPAVESAWISLPQIDVLGHRQFEEIVRDLLRRDGIRAHCVGGAGDRGADVIGSDAWGRTVVVQCKHTTVGAKVGDQVLQVVSGTARPIHQADLALVVTNGGFTRNAVKNAPDYAVLLVDRQLLGRWAAGEESLYRLLGVGAPAAGRWRRLKRVASRST